MKQIPVTFRGEKKLFALVDDEDYEFLSRFNWFVHNERRFPLYACSKIDGKNVLMHSLLLPCDLPLTVDHKNGNGLDNQKSNLRSASWRQQFINTRKRRSCRSKFKGVYQKGNKWGAEICHRYLGQFNTEIEAAKAYNNAAIKEFGEFARLNEFDEPLTETETK